MSVYAPNWEHILACQEAGLYASEGFRSRPLASAIARPARFFLASGRRRAHGILPPRNAGAEAALGTDTDNDRARRAHDFASMRKVQSAHLIGRLRSAYTCATPPSTNNSVPVT